jgi:cytochrome oxidase Cu insertion factor (SCO1/SenC/PrrC family)
MIKVLFYLRILFLIQFFNVFYIRSYCLNYTGDPKIKGATFKCKILAKHPEEYKMTVFFIRDVIASDNIAEDPFTNNIRLYFKTNKLGEFNFKIDNIDHIGRLYITIQRQAANSQVGGSYFVEPGDNIRINIKDDSSGRAPVNDSNGYVPSFLGNGSQKYTCSYLLNRYYKKFSTYGNHLTKDDSSTLVDFYASCQHYKADNIKCLAAFQPSLEADVYFLMKTEISWFPDWIYAGAIRNYFIQYIGNKIMQNEIINIYARYPLKIDTTNSKLLFLSEPWAMATASTVITDLTLKNNRLPSYLEAFEEFKSKFKGGLQEKLFAKLLLDPFTSNKIASSNLEQDNAEIMECLDSAYSLAKTEFVKAYFREQKIFSKGSDAYNFCLKDTSGNDVRLSDFKGKTVLLDAWGTGCFGCAQFYRLYADSIESKIKNDTSFVFVSICDDPNRNQWLKSLHSGIYTSEHHINLNTVPDGLNNIFFTNYRVNTMPFVLLIDKRGKIYQRLRVLGNPQSLYQLFTKAEEN